MPAAAVPTPPWAAGSWAATCWEDGSWGVTASTPLDLEGVFATIPGHAYEVEVGHEYIVAAGHVYRVVETK